ncbi:MAG: ChaN family lipoprotein [Myxococcota bacterium]
MRHFRLLLLCAATAGCASTARAPAPSPASLQLPARWQSPLDVTHPLVGRIWDPAMQAWRTGDEVLARLLAADVVLLGETHDNPDHHLLQAAVLDALVRSGRSPSVAWEMMDVDQQATLDGYLRGSNVTTDGVGHVVQWEERGWPEWDMYAPIARVALTAKLSLLAANLPLARVRALIRQGPGALSSTERAALHLDTPFPPELQAAVEEEMSLSHCGHLPTEMLPAMALAQRARDAQMAQVIRNAKPPVVLISGAGHARTDRGVPFHLRAQSPSLRVVSVAFQEVAPEAQEPTGYRELYGADVIPFDLVWFTPRLPEEDACARIPHPAPKPKPPTLRTAPPVTVDI